MTLGPADDLLARARAWLDEDPDPATRDELTALLEAAAAGEAGAAADLADRFEGTLEFGTAGLRGALGAGPNRMNRVVVSRAAAGLAAYLRQQGARPGQAAVVIGYDARHRSADFARDTAEVLTGAGLSALVLPRPLPTPVLAFAIRDLGCVAGVMVTASHNPAQDNGYKVYLGDGTQIVPPADTAIAACIDAVGALADVRRGTAGRVLDEDVVDRYLDTVAELAGDGPRELSVVYTPLHGVGAEPALQVLETAGFAEPRVVGAQADPDPDFPTVAFPNPEEPGVLDLAIALAARHRADLVVANDPDADRCAVAVPIGTGADSTDVTRWRMLRGDEVGALLAHHLLRRGHAGTYACSIVSSTLLAKMAAAAGQPHVETLTGFKWIGRVPGLAFGYEEALGYCCDPEHVQDKDGISALLLLCELAAELRAEGRTLIDVLDDLAVAHGLHATDQLAVRVDELAAITAAMARIRRTPPVALGGLAVESVDDLATGTTALPATDGLRLHLADGARVVVRPSGTEPKLKCYLEVVLPVSVSVTGSGSGTGLATGSGRESRDAGGVDAARIAAATRLDAIKVDLRAVLALG